MSEISNPALDLADRALAATYDTATGDVANPPLDEPAGAGAAGIDNPSLDDAEGGRGTPSDNPSLDDAGPAGDFGLANPTLDEAALDRLFEEFLEQPVPEDWTAPSVPAKRRSPAKKRAIGATGRKQTASKRTSGKK